MASLAGLAAVFGFLQVPGLAAAQFDLPDPGIAEAVLAETVSADLNLP